MRQFPETLTAQNPARSPRSGCSWKPGRFMSAGSRRHIQPRQDPLDLADALRRNKPPIPFLVEAPKPLVAKPDDHPRSVTRYVTGLSSHCKFAQTALGALLLSRLTPRKRGFRATSHPKASTSSSRPVGEAEPAPDLIRGSAVRPAEIGEGSSGQQREPKLAPARAMHPQPSRPSARAAPCRVRSRCTIYSLVTCHRYSDRVP